MDDLPTIALHNILSRLPIQLLMQYRSVCKSWLRLIDDPYFQKDWVYQGPYGGNLVSFDLGQEEFSWVHIPVDLSEFNTRVELIDMMGYLALCDLTTGQFVEIWVLQEMRTHQWIRKLSIFLDDPVTLTDYIIDVYCYQDSLVFWEYRETTVVKRNRNGRMKISSLGRQELHFVHHDVKTSFLDVMQRMNCLVISMYIARHGLLWNLLHPAYEMKYMKMWRDKGHHD